MSKPVKPCYRVCTLSGDGSRWNPYVSRTRNLLRTLRQLKRCGWTRRQVLVERRPKPSTPMPYPVPEPGRLSLISLYRPGGD